MIKNVIIKIVLLFYLDYFYLKKFVKRIYSEILKENSFELVSLKAQSAVLTQHILTKALQKFDNSLLFISLFTYCLHLV